MDVDGDQDVDVLTNSNSDGHVFWYENDGDEIFTQRTIATDVAEARTVIAVDVDGDGDVDIFPVGAAKPEIVQYENDGGQNFTKRTVSTDVDGPRTVAAGDADNDGDLDLFSISFNDNKIAWYENLDEWAVRNGQDGTGSGATGPDDEGRQVALDAEGNVYVVGSRYFITSANNGDADIFVAKYSPTGDLLWEHQIGGSVTIVAEVLPWTQPVTFTSLVTSVTLSTLTQAAEPTSWRVWEATISLCSSWTRMGTTFGPNAMVRMGEAETLVYPHLFSPFVTSTPVIIAWSSCHPRQRTIQPGAWSFFRFWCPPSRARA